MKKAASNLYIGLIMFFLYAPMLVMIVLSFNGTASTSVMEGFSLKWYQQLLGDNVTLTALSNTLLLAVSSSLISVVLGTMAAVGIHTMKKKWVKNAVLTVTNIPMMNPEIVTGVSMMLLFVFVGSFVSSKDALGFPTLLIAHVTFNLPYVILSVLPKLRQTDKHLSEAAQDLGCTPVSAFFKVVLPNISSGIITGLIMAFTLSLDDFIISYFVTGPKFQTLPIVIFSMTKKKVKPDMYALSTLIFVTVLALLILMNVMQARAENKQKKQIGNKEDKS
ncbi:MAG: ABC transporter permease [Ruminococcus sp.]|nr:ABC transporter permease [Ruminococcus sp.]